MTTTSSLPAPDLDIDCEGLLCPLPVLRLRKRLQGTASGTLVSVRTTDRMADVDLPHFCHESGHAYLGKEDLAGSNPSVTRHFIRVK